MNFPIKSGQARTAGLFGLLFILSGCSLFEKEQAQPICPTVSILSDASTVTKFQDGLGRNLIDEISRGEIKTIESSCSYESEGKTGNQNVIMSLALVIVAERGPANRDRLARFDYFVSVMDPERAILNKETFALQPEFSGNQTRVQFKDEPVALKIPVPQGRRGTDFRVYVGFQLSRQELEYNQRQREPGR
ncbi:MAG: hypothetical protein OEY85_08585 [Rhodospirillales bacterium]|nr:hypothetical protein [Rhodospirillales bacterium]